MTEIALEGSGFTRTGETLCADDCCFATSVTPDLQQRWEQLWVADESAPPNVEPGRFLAITRCLGAEPAPLQLPDGLVVARRERRALRPRIGYLSLRTPPLRSLIVVHGGLLGAVSPQAVLDRVKAMLAERKVDHVMFSRLPLGSPVFKALGQLHGSVVHPAARHWHLDLAQSFDEVMHRHSARHRKRLRWEARRLAAAFDDRLVYRTHERPGELDLALEQAGAISRASYHGRVGGLIEDTPLWRAQLAPAAAEGRLRVHVLSGAERPVAALVGINDRGTLHVLAMAYRPEHAALSPGKHLLLHAIRRACDDGLRRVDYGVGDAEYKRIYGSGFVEEVNLHLYARGIRGRIAEAIDRGALDADAVLRNRLSSEHAQRLKAAWRRAVASNG